MKDINKISLAVLLALGTGAMAQPFAGVSLGVTGARSTDKAHSFSVNSTNSPVTGGIFGGYMFNKYFGLQADMDYIGNFTLTAGPDSSDTSNESIILSASVRGEYPIHNTNFALYGLGGYSHISMKTKFAHNSSTDNADMYHVEAGATYDLDSRVQFGLGLRYAATYNEPVELQLTSVKATAAYTF